jgi:two-component system cell cycle sensor histidine kinase/response regulator CckA
MKVSGKPGKQVLVVDDEPTVCKAFKMLLNFEGHDVEYVHNGAAALALLNERAFDLVITDFSMPGMKGDELAARIKKLRPTQSIILASAFAGDYEFLGHSIGQVDALLIKPFSREALREAIVKALSSHNPDQPGGVSLVAHSPAEQAFVPAAQS